jgi:predicted P-loop ATPase
VANDRWTTGQSIGTSAARQHIAKTPDRHTVKKPIKKLNHILRAAEELLADGCQVIPLPPGRKKPPPTGWPDLRLGDDDLPRYFSDPDPSNLAIALGESSGGLVDVDLDCPDAIEVADFFLPRTSRIFGRPGAERSHYQFRSVGANSRDFKGPDGKSIVQLLSSGRYVVMPPSLHEGTGERIQWAVGPGLQGRDPADVDPDLILHCVALIAVTVLLSRHWPERGGRHDASLAAAGMLLRAGVTPKNAKMVIQLAASLAGDEEAERRGLDVDSTLAALNASKPVVAGTTLAEITGDAPVKLIKKWLAHQGDEAAASTEVPEDLDLPVRVRQFADQLRQIGVSLRHDEFRDRIEVTGLRRYGPWLDDNALATLRHSLPGEKLLGRDLLDELCGCVARAHAFHPIRDRLAACESEWGGKARLDKWLIRWLGAEDSPYTRAVGRIALVAAVRRVRHPGCKFDEMLVIEGSQGSSKSSFLRRLAMEDEWFEDGLQLTATPKELIEQTVGKWIVEVSELGGMRKAEIQAVKAMQSRCVDRARMAYGRKTTDCPRQFIMIGSTNDTHYLRDQTGNRRFWPVRTGRIVLPSPAEIRQLWGEAATRERAGESIRLPKELFAAAQSVQEARTNQDAIAELLDSLLGELKDVRVLCDHVYRAVGFADLSRRTPDVTRRVAEAMSRLSWTRMRLRAEGGRSYHYVHGSGEHEALPVADNLDKIRRFKISTPKRGKRK